LKKIWLILLQALSCYATDLKPWLSDSLVPFLDTTFGYYTFEDPVKEGAYFATMGGRFAFEPYAAELEFDTMSTDFTSYGLEDVRFTARYLLTNDISGENYFSSVIGLSFSYAKNRFIIDPAAFHHAPWEWVVHLSIGKELPCGPIWNYRGWGVLSFGFGNEGSPWFYGKLATEADWLERVRAGVFLEALFGMGDQPFVPTLFTGYGNVQHRSIATGAELSYSLHEWGWLKAEYSFVPWAFNFPIYGQRILVRWELPLGF